MQENTPWDRTALGAAACEQLEALADGAGASIARTMAWSSINSGSYESSHLAVMAETLHSAFSTLPGEVERLPLEPWSRLRPDGSSTPVALGEALRVRVRPGARVQIALTGHYDTVFPADHAFQHVTEHADRLQGPGVADMKGGLSVMLDALTAFERLPEAANVGYTVLLSPDEEIGSPASAALLSELGARCCFGMTYEPATPDGFLVDARSGSGNFALWIGGRAAHVGRAFGEGRNAVAAAARFAAALDALNGREEGATFNVAVIEGGGPLNIVPDRALVRFNIRALDERQRAWCAEQLACLVGNVRAEPDLHVVLDGGFTRPPKPLTRAQQAAAALVAQAGAWLGLQLQFRRSGGVCEGNNLAAAGCPNIDTLGVVGGGLHSSDEFALKHSFGERAQLSLAIVAGIAQGGLDLRRLSA